MKRLLIIIVVVLCASTFTQPVQACLCREYGTPICARYWRSDAVFVGEVRDIKPLKNVWDDPYSYVLVTFAVQESFRGVSGPRIGIATATTMCDTVFKKGKRYLVYASRDNQTGQLFTGMCTGSRLAYDMDEYFQELRQLKQQQAGESISGRIVINRSMGLPALDIEITSKDKTFKTLTDKYGHFSVSLPGPGSFKVRVLLPYLARLMGQSNDEVGIRGTQTESLTTFEYDVTLEKSECSYVELDVDGSDPHATATVTGNVLTATGQAVDKGIVDLINGLGNGRDYIAFLNSDGSFRFENVSPGEYYIVLNAAHDVLEEYDAPYARTYYPATVEKREAKKIQVTEGAAIENLVMRVGERMSERTVEGKVVWKSGRPLESAYIRVYSGDKYVRRAEIMREAGTFKFHLYGDFDYSIEAWDDIDEIEGRSQRVKILQGNSAGHKLIIQRIRK
jgi:hypothetical protein